MGAAQLSEIDTNNCANNNDRQQRTPIDQHQHQHQQQHAYRCNQQTNVQHHECNGNTKFISSGISLNNQSQCSADYFVETNQEEEEEEEEEEDEGDLLAMNGCNGTRICQSRQHLENEQSHLLYCKKGEKGHNSASTSSSATTSIYSNGYSKCDFNNETHASQPNEIKLSSTGSTGSSLSSIKRTGPICGNKVKPAPDPPIHIVLCAYLSYAILIVFGYLRDFLRSTGIEENKAAVEANRPGYVPLYKSWFNFFNRNLYHRVLNVFSQPIASVPGGFVEVLDRVSPDYNWTFSYTGKIDRAINLGSYNYLGFAENNGIVADNVEQTINEYAVGIPSTHHEVGRLSIHNELEELFARFLGTEACITFGMGFATNSTNIPAITGKGCLVIGDELNHASLKLGINLSGAHYMAFKHNDMKDLEKKLRHTILVGDLRRKRPWKKIVIVIEGVYSMEGSIANLPDIIRLKKKYKCYLYVDEAHSIGAIGPRGRGIVDYYGCDVGDVDLLMGTLTKSFGAAGGYIAGRKDVIDHIRVHSYSAYACSMAPPIATQIISVLRILMGETGGQDGQERVDRLLRNSLYFRKKLQQLGFIVNGHPDSPVIPIMIYIPGQVCAFVRYGLKKGIATVAAGYPATSLTTCRIRLCMSAAHDKKMVDEAIHIISQLGDLFRVKYANYLWNTSKSKQRKQKLLNIKVEY